MRAHEFAIAEKKKRKRRPRWAAYGPGPYGGYGFVAGYGGDGGVSAGGDAGGVGEASYDGNIGAMEVFKFMNTASNFEKELLKKLIAQKAYAKAWALVQGVTGTKLQGKEFEVDEGIKDTLMNLGVSAAIATGSLGGLTIKQALTSPSIPTETKIEIIKQADLKKDDIPKLISAVKKETPKASAEKTQQKKVVVKPITDNPLEKVLLKTAMASGLKGAELAAFMAQCAHETMDFRSLVEFGGSLDFRKYDPKYAPKKAKALGNKKAGDGARYKGRGFIQITGRYNYKRAGEELGLPLEAKPELVQKPEIAAKVAVWFWKHRVQPKVDNFHDVNSVTKPINPSMNGLQDRKENFRDYMQVAMR